MKTTILFKISLILAIIFTSSFSFAAKTDRSAKKEARKLKRQGYYVLPGNLPMQQQLAKSYSMASAIDDSGDERFIFSDGVAVGQTKSAALAHATENAKVHLASQVRTHVFGIIKSDISNSQLSEDKARSLTKLVSVYMNTVSVELGNMKTIVKLYKKAGKNVEVMVRVAFTAESAEYLVKDQVVKSLEEDTNLAREQLESIFNGSLDSDL